MEQLGTTAVSVIGPGESGRTRYEVKEIQSRLVFHNPQQSTTRTALDSPITMTCKYCQQLHYKFKSCQIRLQFLTPDTYEEGASQIYQSSPPAQITGATPDQVLYYFGVVLNCNLDTSKAEGVCVEVDDVGSFQTGASPLTTTYTGSIMPWATVTTSSGLKTTGNSVVAVGIAVLGVLSGAVFILV